MEARVGGSCNGTSLWLLFFFMMPDRLLGIADVSLVTVLCVVLLELGFSETVRRLVVISALL